LTNGFCGKTRSSNSIILDLIIELSTAYPDHKYHNSKIRKSYKKLAVVATDEKIGIQLIWNMDEIQAKMGM
jgi:hypothetical protein